MCRDESRRSIEKKTTRIESTKSISPLPKNPINSAVSIESNDSLGFGSEMMLSDIGQDLKSLSLSIGFDSQLSQSPKPLYKPLKKHVNRICTSDYQHSLKGSKIPEDLAKINMLDSLDDYRVRVIFNRGN